MISAIVRAIVVSTQVSVDYAKKKMRSVALFYFWAGLGLSDDRNSIPQ